MVMQKSEILIRGGKSPTVSEADLPEIAGASDKNVYIGVKSAASAYNRILSFDSVPHWLSPAALDREFIFSGWLLVWRECLFSQAR